MQVEEYIIAEGMRHKNKNGKFEFHSISSLCEFLEGALRRCPKPVLSGICCSNPIIRSHCNEEFCENCGHYFNSDYQ